MSEYHKIQTVFKRDPNNKKDLIQGAFSLPEFEYLQHNEWEFTEKVDGTNIRVVRRYDLNTDTETVTFGGKTNNALIPAELLTRLQERFLVSGAFDHFGPSDVVLYGEGYGAGIQKGGIYRPDQDFVLFDVWVVPKPDNKHPLPPYGGWWLNRENVSQVALRLGIDVVPVIGTGTLWDMVRLVCDGRFVSQWKLVGTRVEGIVARPANVDLFTRKGERIITKLKRRDYGL